MIYQRNLIKELSFTAVGIFVVLLAVLVSTQAINLLGRAADGRVAIDAVLALVGFWVIGMTPLLLVLTAFSFTAVGIFVVLLAVLVSTQAINLLGRAADGRVAIDAVLALVGFWVIGMTPLLLVLTAFISTLTVLTRYWRDSEMSVWLSCGLALKQWIRPVMQFAVPFAVLVAVMQLWVIPWAELRSREYAEILKQKQELSLVEAGEFNSLGKRNGRVYFVETFDNRRFRQNKPCRCACPNWQSYAAANTLKS